MSPLIKYLLKTSKKQRLNSHQVGGFTMVELLVATVMSFLIITPILAFAVNILNDDVKEQAKASTELELQSALDYIQQDISQAYYIYDGAGVNAIKGQLYDIPNVNNEVPVLVFWKRELVRNAIDVTATPSPIVCASPASDDDDDGAKICDDTYVDSLVAYYLVPGDSTNFPQWCQPGSSACPARIERWSIKDGVKSPNGTSLSNSDKGFNSYNYDAVTTDAVTYPLSWQNSGYDATTPKSQVLVNYIDVGVIPRPNASPFFCANTLGLATASEINYRIGTNDPTTRLNFTGFSGCVDSSKNIAQITIRGDALRRNEARNVYCPSVSPAPAGQTVPQPNYCPSVTGQIGGRSGFGQ